MTDRVRVLVVDDSAFARKVLSECLLAHPQIDLVGIAKDGLEALELIARLSPDVVTADLVMPNLDGIGLLRAMTREQRARVVVVSKSDRDTDLGIEALTLGAFDIVVKPTTLATDRLYGLASELVAKVLLAAPRPQRALFAPAPPPAATPVARSGGPVRLIVVGASTGGPAALLRFVSALPKDLSAPVVVALHIMPGFTTALAERLDRAAALRVVEAHDGIELSPGTVVIARGGQHLRIRGTDGALRGHLEVPDREGFRPSVDLLFASAATATGAHTLGVVLTGMGEDGLIGARLLVEQGGTVVNEAEETCVVYGMPRAVAVAGLSSAAVRIEDMAPWVTRTVRLRADVDGGEVRPFDA